MQRLPLVPPRGLFGGGRRQTFPGLLGAAGYAPETADAPPISAAPPPPANWQDQLGPGLLDSLPQVDPYAANGIGAGSAVNAGTLGQSVGNLPAMPPRVGGLIGGGRGRMGDKMSLGTGLPTMTAEGNLQKKGKGFDWRLAAGILGDALAGLNGQPPLFAQSMLKERQAKADHQRQLSEIMLRSRLDLAKPDYFTAGNDRVRYDPTTGATQKLYTAPEEFDTYARALGAEPGTEEYDLLAQDYILRSSGPTATANDQILEEGRQDNRIELEDHRYGNRQGLERQRQANRLQLRGTPTYRQANPVERRPRQSPVGGAGGRGIREGQTASGPGGAKLVYRGGKWVPLK